MIAKIFLCIIFLVSLASQAKPHRHAKAHVHGHAKIDLAFEETKGHFEFEAPADGLLGFEHAPKTEKEKKIFEDLKNQLLNNIKTYVVLDPKLQCVFATPEIKLDIEEKGHADFKADFDIQCVQSPKNTQIKFDFSSFPKLKKINVTVLADELQKSLVLKGKSQSLDLK